MNTERTSLFLMANLGAEVSRIFSAKAKNDFELVSAALERATLILSQIKIKKDMQVRSEEISILDNVIKDVAKPNPTLHISEKNLKAYFIPFLMRAVN